VQDLLSKYVAEVSVARRSLQADMLSSDHVSAPLCQAKESRGGGVEAEEEVAAGLTAYFDKCLVPVLLYRAERAQAAEVQFRSPLLCRPPQDL
jgi:hypothetical protein